MDAATVGDLFDRERRSEEPALEDATGRMYDYHWLCTSSWKAGNFLRHSGVRRGVTVGVVGDGPLALLSFFGTALLEATTRFDPPRELRGECADGCEADGRDGEEFRALVAPVDALEAYDLPRGAQRVGYGRKPEDPSVHHLDAGLWSENPSFPPLEIDPDTPLLSDGDGRYGHGAVVTAAREIVDERGIDGNTRVYVAAPLADPRAVTAGVIAPLLAGGTIVLPAAAPETGGRTETDVIVGEPDENSAPSGDHIALSDVDLDRS